MFLYFNDQGAEPKILETYSKLEMKDALDLLKKSQSVCIITIL